MPELLEGLLPLGEPLIAAVVAVGGSVFTYLVGRRGRKQELENLQAEKKSVEAASGVSTAEAAQIISQAAAETVRPLLERLKEQREENTKLDDELLYKDTIIRNYKIEVEDLRNRVTRLAMQNKLMREKFKLQGEVPPELPSGGNTNDSLF